VRPIPVVFHIGPLQVHTYGIGLALTFWFGYRYLAKRLRDNGYPDAWLGGTFIWIVVTAIIGARLVHVVANFGYYSAHPIEVFAVWHGGLSSFGGLLFAIPAGLASARRRCPELRLGVAADLVAPVLVAAWALGRLLGPQFMVAGGGKRTNDWFGMYYAGEVGKRLPVPLFQAAECFAVFLVALWVERRIRASGGPLGAVTGVAVGLWGLSRFFDEYLWLTHDTGTDAVEITGLALFAAGIGLACWLLWRHCRSVGNRGLDPGPGLRVRVDASGVDGGDTRTIDRAPDPSGVASLGGERRTVT
jgi:phosphatidylglycerol:prolipoprotein diacylglycerol transferase